MFGESAKAIAATRSARRVDSLVVLQPVADKRRKRILLVMRTRTYRAKAFLRAASQVGIDVTVATEREQPLSRATRGALLELDFLHDGRAKSQLMSFAEEYPLDAVVGVDDDTTI